MNQLLGQTKVHNAQDWQLTVIYETRLAINNQRLSENNLQNNRWHQNFLVLLILAEVVQWIESTIILIEKTELFVWKCN